MASILPTGGIGVGAGVIVQVGVAAGGVAEGVDVGDISGVDVGSTDGVAVGTGVELGSTVGVAMGVAVG